MPIDERATSAADPAQDLAADLRALRIRAGSPSLRSIAAAIGTVSHTTVAEALSGKRTPSWPAVAAVVTQLGGDEYAFRSRWVAATSESPAPTAPEREDVLFISRYRQRAADFYNSFSDLTTGDRVAFNDAYVPPRVMKQLGPGSEGGTIELDLHQFDDEIRYAVLLGPPGSGKSELCQALLLRHALVDSLPTAFLVPLRPFAAKPLPDRSVVGFIEQSLEAVFQIRPPKGLIERHLQREPTLMIFDGFDELVDTERRARVASILRLFIREFPLAHILVASRDATYRDGLLDQGLFTTYRMESTGMLNAALEKLKSSSLAESVHAWEVSPEVPEDVSSALMMLRDLALRSTTEPPFASHAISWGWATLENCLRGVLQDAENDHRDHTKPWRKHTGWQLAREAEAQGLLMANDSERLRSAWELRNTIVHGLQPSTIAPVSAVIEALGAINRAISNLYESAASRH